MLPLFFLLLGLAESVYTGVGSTRFHPSQSSTFELIQLHNVNVTFLDETNLLGYDGADVAELGGYRVKTRFGLIEQCNSANFDFVDGILGFGWANSTRTAALLRTLTTTARPHWHITQGPDYVPMPRRFAFTASQEKGELQLGDYDPASVEGQVDYFPMVGAAYGVNVTSITYGENGPELLHFAQSSGQPLGREPTAAEAHGPGATAAGPGIAPPAYVGDFDSGTTCLLLPNTTVNGTFLIPPYQALYALELTGLKQPLIYTIGGKKYSMAYSECVDAADSALILGDAWFRKFVVVHDLRDLDKPLMGLGLQKAGYNVGAATDATAQLLQVATNGRSKTAAKRSILSTAGHPLNTVRKVPLVSQRHVTYNIDLSVGTPPQPVSVIFDTGSFMLAIFADPPPPGMKPTGLLEVGVQELTGSRTPSLFDDSFLGNALLVVNAALLVAVLVAALNAQSKRRSRMELAAGARSAMYGTIAAEDV